MNKIKVEIADTFEKQSVGLMFRKSMPDNTGMIFVYKKPIVLSFWMANTYIPLDIAFLDENMVVKEIHNMAPLSTRSTRSSMPCKYAVEVPVGTFEKHDITINSKIKFNGNDICLDK